MDEESGPRADSVGSNTLTDVNTVGSSATGGPYGDRCADFEDTNDEYFYCNDNVALSITGDLSFSCWFMFETKVDTCFFSKDRQTPKAFAVTGYWNTSNVLRFRVGDTFNGVTWNPSTATWYLLTFSYDASAGSCQFFVDGSSLGTQTGYPTSISDNDVPFQIGSLYSNVLVWEPDGMMQDAIIWGYALSSTDVSNLYSSYSAPSSAIKTINGLAKASCKTFNGLSIASIKSFNGLQ